jgi:hypothetical protein
MGKRLGLLALVMAAATALGACTFARSAFESKAGDAGSELAAAAQTIRFVHQGKLTAAYARAAFVNYQSALEGLDSELPESDGAPAKGMVDRLIDLYRKAFPAVEQPCLSAGCDWQQQVSRMDQASQALLKAGGEQ